ncbi:MAG: FAD-dependent oxidoreductase [Methylovirgula sp.]
MSAAEHLDVLVLGSGQAGNLMAWHMARSGYRTALIERRWIGGSCPNIACMPSKNEVWSARVAHLVRNAGHFGTITTPGKIDMGQVRQRKRDMVSGEVAGFLEGFKSSGAELIRGSGRFTGPKTLEVQLNDGGTRLLTADKVFLNIGTHSAMPNIPGLEAAKPLTHIDILEIDYVPSHLVVLGGGYVGLEFAQAYRRFGSAVTVIDAGPQIISREDTDSAEAIARILSDEGIRILAGAKIIKVEGSSGKAVTLSLQTSGSEERIEASDILVATGRVPNTAGIGLEGAGVALDDRGYIRVNERLETSAPDVWAMGECAGSPQFTHASVDDFRIVKDNLAGGARSTKNRLVPYCLFTDPPLAHVGLSERDAQRQGISVRVAKTADAGRAARPYDGREAWISEDPDRRQRSHRRLHNDWRGSW